MNAPTPHSSLATSQPDNAIVTMGFGSLQSFEFMQRTAKMFAASSMVPTAYRAQIVKREKDINGEWIDVVEDNPAAIPNCVIALNMSQRMNADPLMIMQNLHVIEGRPSWSSQFIIAAINSCGRYSPLRFDIVLGEEIDATHTTFEGWGKNKKPIVTKVRVKNATCIAWAFELATKTRLESPKVSMEMAVNEGWYGKNGSKWQSMPDLMLRYRSAAFFGRIYAPELLMGLPAADEVHDIIDVRPQADGSYAADLVQAESRPARSERGAGAQDAAVKEAYPAEQFEKNLPGWLKIIADGKKTAEQIISMAQSKHPLTDAQQAAIRTPPAAAPAAAPAGPVITYAHVAAKLHAAQDVDQLDTAADLIGEVADPEQRVELSAIYDTARNKFQGALL